VSFIERNPVVIGLIAAALAAVVTVGALSIQGSLLRGGYELVTEFSDAAGLRPGDDIFVAGVRAGTVKSIDIVDDHVEIRLSVYGHELPAETRAQIVVRTLTGNRGLELVAEGDFDELLADGDLIPMERTDLPVDAPEFGDVSEELLRKADSAALNELLVSLTDVTRGQREEIARLIEGGNRVTAVVNRQEEDLRSLLSSLAEVASVLNSSGDEIIAVIDEFSATLATLREHRAELQRFFEQTNTTAATAADLVGRERAELDRILSDVHEVTDALSRHQMDLAEALAYAGDSIVGFSSIGYSGKMKVPWGHVFANSAGPLGIDVIAACGGLVDQRLDDILGPDPRTCEEQENDTFPEDPNEQQGNREPSEDDGGADAGGSQSGPAAAPQPQSLDALARRALGLQPPREQGP
jgi:phospholipid/cholesterol/gamma-HCH transport system substrate-binding protein